MKIWEPGTGLGYVAYSLENAQECMKFGFEKHLEVFGIEANVVRIGKSFQWPEAFGVYAVVEDSVRTPGMMLVCRDE